MFLVLRRKKECKRKDVFTETPKGEEIVPPRLRGDRKQWMKGFSLPRGAQGEGILSSHDTGHIILLKYLLVIISKII